MSGAEQAATPEDEVAILRADAAALKEQALRYAAEVENTKRRAEREVNDARAYAIQKFAATFWVWPTTSRAPCSMLPRTPRIRPRETSRSAWR